MRVLPYGPEGWLVELPETDVVGYAAAVARHAHPGVAEVVPAARTVLVRLSADAPAAEVGAWLTGVVPDAVDDTGSGSVIELTVSYDGEDLAAVARSCGTTVDDVIARHAASPFVCAFCGFAPGFAYLGGLDPALVLPRRATPRTRVPAGSVAIADTYSAVYPSVSPGGWHLLGRTDAALWDPTREAPALITPGTAVRFVPA